ncbi:MAG: alpha/beta hydrolase [Betaproteobacteria bacterium]|nr:alpha/beta hydrolase [Betaproteobacteria bacterium]
MARCSVKPSHSLFVDVRGLRYHCRCWGEPDRPKLFLLHGWMDVSASFQFLVDALRRNWRVIAPDWRGYGLSDWSGSDSYWFPDYFADLDCLLERLAPGEAVDLVGHSMGSNVAGMYAGIRPERVAHLVCLEGFGMAPPRAEEAPRRYARWFEQIGKGARFRDYESFDALAQRLRHSNPRLTAARSLFLAEHWGALTPAGRVCLRADPAHKLVNPVLYRIEEAKACWRLVTAPVLWVQGEGLEKRTKITAADLAERKACFRSFKEEVMAGAGHMLHHDQPEKLAALIESFIP